MIYGFRQVGPQDAALLRDWRSRTHVAEWWGPPGEDDEPEEEWVSRWVVGLEGRDFAYLQDYAVHAEPGHHFAHLPQGARGIDQYIGEADMLGRGHGHRLIAQRVDELFAAGVPVVATDPHPDNARAIAAYRKAGFSVAGPPQETRWGRILPMTVRQVS